MKTQDEADKPFRVVLDDLTTARLLELADMQHASPNTMIAAIVRDVLQDDAEQHDHEIQLVTLQ
jgi:hypothetical protein